MSTGEISRRLHGKLKAVSSGVALPTTSKGRKPIPGTPDIAKLVAEGMDPIHATYVFIHHITSSFASNVSQLPEMRTFTEDYAKAEEQYLPSGPRSSFANRCESSSQVRDVPWLAGPEPS